MSGDYETLEINQPKISYLKKRSENILLLQEKIKEIEKIRRQHFMDSLNE